MYQHTEQLHGQTERRHYTQGTYLDVTYPYGWNVGGKALCQDGIVRPLKRVSPTADTTFSIPASVKAHGKTIAGFITFHGDSGMDSDSNTHVAFIAYSYRKNGDVIGHVCQADGCDNEPHGVRQFCDQHDPLNRTRTDIAGYYYETVNNNKQTGADK